MQLFIIYAREDNEEKERIYDLIQKPLSDMGVSVWHDSFIRIGDNWEEILLRPCWYSTPIFATFLAVVVSIDQQRIALKYFN